MNPTRQRRAKVKLEVFQWYIQSRAISANIPALQDRLLLSLFKTMTEVPLN